MFHFGKEETAGDVRREFESNIDNFLDKYEPRGFLRRKRTLKDLFKWSKSTWEAKSRLEAVNTDLKQRLQAAHNQIQALNSALQETNQELSEEKTLREKRDQELGSINEHWTAILNDAHSAHGAEMQNTKQEHQNIILTIEATHAAEVANFKNRITKLTQDILVNQADSRAWTDEKLRVRFGELRQTIDNITSPHSLIVHERENVRSQIDPHGFLQRHGVERYHFLVKSVIWNILYLHFFSAPLGFGALGPDRGRDSLLRIYATWRSLFDGKEDISEASYTSVFNRDTEANKWRSSTFESIMASVIAGEKGVSGRSLALLYTTNVQMAADKISTTLSDVSSSGLASDTMAAIKKISRLSSELALQFGVQPSHLNLSLPARKQVVEIGREFFDCIDGDIDKGQRVAVDIVVSPGLDRRGDGKDDMTSKLLLVPCEIFPLP